MQTLATDFYRVLNFGKLCVISCMHTVIVDVIDEAPRIAIGLHGRFDHIFARSLKRDRQEFVSVRLAPSRCSLIFVTIRLLGLLSNVHSCTVCEHAARIRLLSLRVLAQDGISIAPLHLLLIHPPLRVFLLLDACTIELGFALGHDLLP